MQIRGRKEPASASGLAACIQSLVSDGRAAVSVHPSDGPDTDALPLLEHLDSLARNELALSLPAFSPAAALWGARLFHQLCVFVVCRDISEDRISAVCAESCAEQRCPKTDWSVDITLHHLPKLFQLARQLSNADPLIRHMKQIAVTWPLSSVGIAGLENMRLESFIDDPALLRLYADRTIAVGDTSRLSDPVVDNLLRADLGIHHELAPVIASKLFEIKHDTD